MNPLMRRISQGTFPGRVEPEMEGFSSRRPATAFTRRILFLQTDWPMGMVKLAQDLQDAHHEVVKVVLNPADFYYRLNGVPVVVYRDTLAGWEEWLRNLISSRGFDTLVTFNHLRPYNRIAMKVAGEFGLNVAVIELGLIRPQHLTAYLTSAWTPEDIPALWGQVRSEELSIAIRQQAIPQAVRSVSTAQYNVRFFAFAGIGLILRRIFPYYRDQQAFRFLRSMGKFLCWMRRSCSNDPEDQRIESRLLGEWKGRFFVVPLQLPYDTQIVDRSRYDSMEQFLEEVLTSFAAHAPEDAILVLKTHPQDPGLICYRSWLDKILQSLQLESRVFLVGRCRLPLVLPCARGVVTVNSTVGLTALREGVPVKAAGEAIYDVPGLTDEKPLDEFWAEPAPPEPGAVPRFVRLLESTIQARGSLIRRCFPVESHCGVMWPAPFAEFFGLAHVLESQVPHPVGTTPPACAAAGLGRGGRGGSGG